MSNNFIELPDFAAEPAPSPAPAVAAGAPAQAVSAAAPFLTEAVLDVPVRVQAVLARRRISVSDLLAIRPGAVVPLEKRVGEPIEIMVNDRLVGRGELVRIDEGIGVTMTEIVVQDR